MGSLSTRSGLLLPRQPDEFRTWQEYGRHLRDIVAHLVRDDEQPTRWNDLVTSIGSVMLADASDPPAEAYKGGYVRNFRDANSDIVYFNLSLSHMVDETLPLEMHVYCTVKDNNSGNVRWQMTHSWAGVGGVFPTATTPTAVDVAVAANSLDKHLRHTVVASISPPAGNTIGAMLICSLTRLGSADSYNGDVLVTGLGFHEPRNTNRGSQIEGSKWDR
jgi:hypothetical protein